MKDELKNRAIALLKDAYSVGYEDGVKATNVDCGVVWEERIDAIKSEIEFERDRKFGGEFFEAVQYRSFNKCLEIIDRYIGGDNNVSQ